MTRRDVLLKALASTSSDVDRVVGRIDTPDKGSLTPVLNQMVAFETQYRTQLQRIIREESPTLPALRFEDASHESHVSLRESVFRFTAARQQTLAFLKGLTPGEWQRKAVHEVLGKTSLRFLVQDLVDQDTRHLSWLVEARQGIGTSSTPVRQMGSSVRANSPSIDSEVRNERKRARKWPRKRIPGGD